MGALEAEPASREARRPCARRGKGGIARAVLVSSVEPGVRTIGSHQVLEFRAETGVWTEARLTLHLRA
jgi:hypothetical protein